MFSALGAAAGGTPVVHNQAVHFGQLVLGNERTKQYAEARDGQIAVSNASIVSKINGCLWVLFQTIFRPREWAEFWRSTG